MPVPHNYHDRGIHGPMYHDHGPLHTHHYLPHPHTYHVPPCPPPHPHVDICVPYDDTALWMAIERLQQELDDEIQARKDADDVLQAEIDDLQDQIDHLQDEIDDLQDQIDDIDTEIENIYETLEDMLSESTNYTDLDEGTDYEIGWYNNYGKQSGYTSQVTPYVRLQQTVLKTTKKKYTTNVIHVISNTNHRVSNSTTISSSTSKPIFRHGDDWEETDECWILRVTLLNDYGSYKSTEAVGTTIVWNMSPSSKRASWDVACNMHHTTNGSHDALILDATQISDGYNTQYASAYCSSGTLTYGLLNFHNSATFVKTENL